MSGEEETTSSQLRPLPLEEGWLRLQTVKVKHLLSLSYGSQNHQSRDGTIHNELTGPSHINQENIPESCPQATLWWGFGAVVDDPPETVSRKKSLLLNCNRKINVVSQSHSKQSASTHDRATLPNAKSREGHGPNRFAGSAGAALQSSPETPGPQPALLRAPQAAGANPTQPQRTSRSPAGQELQLDSDTPCYEEVAAT
ncbi:hypothetical protein U0070_020858 [Myodes glareolus]|uniref:Uncharacterized protein n=1 Tax=Myodes glareolus TaxID=447135 RepID=A0AAW0IQ87_MYOGA